MSNVVQFPGSGQRAKIHHNASAEESVLGGLICEPALLAELDTLEVEDFFHPRNKIVFQAIRNLAAAGKPIDVVTLEVEIEKAEKLDAAGGVAYLGELCTRVPVVASTMTYAAEVLLHSRNRKVATTLKSAAHRADTWAHEPDELLRETIGELERISTQYATRTAKASPVISVHQALEELVALASTPVYTTPFDGLNVALGFGGMLAGQVYFLAGGTGFGKTSWLGSVVKFHAMNGGHALVAFYEMFAGYYVARMTAKPLGCHANAILRGEIGMGLVAAAMPQNIEFLDAPSLATLRLVIDEHIAAGLPPPLVVVDYIQLLGDQVLATMARPDPRQANTLASAGLRAIAKATKCVILVVSAASRSVGKKLAGDVRKTPPRDLIDAAKESGAIEYDGAGVIVLSVSDETDGDEMVATMTVAKARFGEAQHLDARFDGRTGWWRECGRVTRSMAVATPPPTAASASSKAHVSIMRVLSAGPQKSKNKIYALTGGTKEAVHSEIDAMLDTGILQLSGAGIGLRAVPESAGSPAQTTMPGGLA